MLASLITSNYYIMHTALSLFLILSNQNVQCGSLTGSNRVEANNRVLGSLDKTSSQKICKKLKGQIDRAYEQTDFSILRSVFSTAQIRPKNVQINSILLQIHEAFKLPFQNKWGERFKTAFMGEYPIAFHHDFVCLNIVTCCIWCFRFSAGKISCCYDNILLPDANSFLSLQNWLSQNCIWAELAFLKVT